MNILLLCDELMSRTRLASAWKQAGATVIKSVDGTTPDYIVVDLTARDALERVAQWRAAFPSVDILAFGPHVEGDKLSAAKAAGASELAARGSVLERVVKAIAHRRTPTSSTSN